MNGNHFKETKFAYIFLTALLLLPLFQYRAGAQEEPDKLVIEIQENPLYKKAHEFANYSYIRFVLAGNSEDEWSEAFEIFDFPRTYMQASPAIFFEAQKENRLAKCARARFSILDQEDSKVLWQTETLDCPEMNDQHSLSLILQGRTDVFVLIYTKIIRQIDNAVIEKWKNYLGKAYLK